MILSPAIAHGRLALLPLSQFSREVLRCLCAPPPTVPLAQQLPGPYYSAASSTANFDIRAMWLLDTTTITLSQQHDDDVRYAILSHQWGNENEEVSFADVQDTDVARRKQGYRKIELCCEQARKDGYKFAWVDTCCIDKSSSAELQVRFIQAPGGGLLMRQTVVGGHQQHVPMV